MSWPDFTRNSSLASMSKKEIEAEIVILEEKFLKKGGLPYRQQKRLKSLKIELGHRKYKSTFVSIVRG